MSSEKHEDVNFDGLVKSKFPLPLAGGNKREGGIIFMNTVSYRPHPNPPPSRGREFWTFDEGINFGRFGILWRLAMATLFVIEGRQSF